MLSFTYTDVLEELLLNVMTDIGMSDNDMYT